VYGLMLFVGLFFLVDVMMFVWGGLFLCYGCWEGFVVVWLLCVRLGG
jgi:hypothetical protein